MSSPSHQARSWFRQHCIHILFLARMIFSVYKTRVMVRCCANPLSYEDEYMIDSDEYMFAVTE